MRYPSVRARCPSCVDLGVMVPDLVSKMMYCNHCRRWVHASELRDVNFIRPALTPREKRERFLRRLRRS